MWTHAFTHQMSWHQLKLHQQKCRTIPQNHVHLGPSPPQNWCHLTTPVHQGSFNNHFHWPPTPCHSRARYILTVGSVPNLDGCFFSHMGKIHIMWNCLVISSSDIPISKEWTQCFFWVNRCENGFFCHTFPNQQKDGCLYFYPSFFGDAETEKEQTRIPKDNVLKTKKTQVLPARELRILYLNRFCFLFFVA